MCFEVVSSVSPKSLLSALSTLTILLVRCGNGDSRFVGNCDIRFAPLLGISVRVYSLSLEASCCRYLCDNSFHEVMMQLFTSIPILSNFSLVIKYLLFLYCLRKGVTMQTLGQKVISKLIRHGRRKRLAKFRSNNWKEKEKSKSTNNERESNK